MSKWFDNLMANAFGVVFTIGFFVLAALLVFALWVHLITIVVNVLKQVF